MILIFYIILCIWLSFIKGVLHSQTTAIFRRSAVPVSKRWASLASWLLTLLHRRVDEESLWSSPEKIASLSASCVQFCSKHMWPHGIVKELEYTGWERLGVGETDTNAAIGKPLFILGKDFPVWLLFGTRAHTPVSNPHSCKVSPINQLVPQGDVWQNWTSACSWDLMMRGSTLPSAPPLPARKFSL